MGLFRREPDSRADGIDNADARALEVGRLLLGLFDIFLDEIRRREQASKDVSADEKDSGQDAEKNWR